VIKVRGSVGVNSSYGKSSPEVKGTLLYDFCHYTYLTIKKIIYDSSRVDIYISLYIGIVVYYMYP
jgi:hypothetical protein